MLAEAGVLVELCVEDLQGVLVARRGGADRVELCQDLSCGGLTPPLGLVRECLAHAPDGGLQVLVRPRPGGFVYSPEEVGQMLRTVTSLLALGHRAPVRLGLVVGALRDDGQVDTAAAHALRQAAGPAPLTFHRAFDQVPDQGRALEELIALGYDRVLTTGGHPGAAQVGPLAGLVRQAGERITVLVSGGLRAGNVAQVVERTGAREVHMRAPAPDGTGTDPDQVRAILRALGR